MNKILMSAAALAALTLTAQAVTTTAAKEEAMAQNRLTQPNTMKSQWQRHRSTGTV